MPTHEGFPVNVVDFHEKNLYEMLGILLNHIAVLNMH